MMAGVTEDGYIRTKQDCSECGKSRASWKTSWKVKIGHLGLNTIYFPKEYIGKTIKLKVEVME